MTSTASSGRSKSVPTASACFFVICICPTRAAAAHSWEALAVLALSGHSVPAFGCQNAVGSVASSRFVGFVRLAVSASRFIAAPPSGPEVDALRQRGVVQAGVHVRRLRRAVQLAAVVQL